MGGSAGKPPRVAQRAQQPRPMLLLLLL